MRIEGFPSPGWEGARVPDPDPVADEERRRVYWEWLGTARLGPDDAPRLCAAGDGRDWVQVVTGLQADYESSHMRHSVGHSFDHYGALGPIYSLRDADNVPSVTILVSDGTVVHARRAENAPLTPADLSEVRRLARERGWDVAPPEGL